MTVELTDWHVNRLHRPQGWILICEDDSSWQRKFIKFLEDRYGPQGKYLFVACPSTIFAMGPIAMARTPEAILLDHDMPWGHGPDLMKYLKTNDITVPVCAVSGIDSNNKALKEMGAKAIAKKGNWHDLVLFLEDYVE